MAATIGGGALGFLVLLAACSASPTLPPNTVAVPSAGDTSPSFLSDGSPVFVVAHADGTITILEATSTHRPWGIAKLLAWCPSGRQFMDLQHGATYDEWGRVVGGPAPTGLDRFASLPADAPGNRQVVVGASIGQMAGPPASRGAAESCFGESERLVAHDFDGVEPMSPGEALAAGGTRWLLVEGSLDASNRRMCGDPACAESVPVAGLDLHGEIGPAADLGRYLVRVADGALIDLTVVARLST